MNSVGRLVAERPAVSIGWIVLALMSFAVATASYRYLIDFGPVPPAIAANKFKHPWLVLHAASAATALLVGPIQFVSRVRAARPKLHRWLGRIYVVCCIAGGITGLVLALGASTGPVSVLGFGLLAVAWTVSTVIAWRAAVERRFAQHQAWMIRSFALTCAALTLRVYIPTLEVLPVPFETGYRVISFACWVPNVLIAELLLSDWFKNRWAQSRDAVAK